MLITILIITSMQWDFQVGFMDIGNNSTGGSMEEIIKLIEIILKELNKWVHQTERKGDRAMNKEIISLALAIIIAVLKKK